MKKSILIAITLIAAAACVQEQPQRQQDLDKQEESKKTEVKSDANDETDLSGMGTEDIEPSGNTIDWSTQS